MAKKTRSKTSNAHGTPSSLTKLLSRPGTVQPAITVARRLPTIPPLLTGDRRYYQPDASVRPAHASTRTASRLVVREPRPDPLGDSIRAQGAGLPTGIQFRVPKQVAVCVRRNMRREVLFAKRAKIGNGARRRNMWSKISC